MAVFHRFVLVLLATTCFSQLHAQQTAPPADPAFLQQYQAARTALSAGKDKQALESFKKANKLKNDACVECELGIAAASIRLGHVPDALNSCDKALALANDNSSRSTIHAMKARALLSSGRDEKTMQQAEQQLRLAVELSPNDPILHLNLAFALAREKKDDEAKGECKQCLALKPTPVVAKEADDLMADPRRAREELAPEFQVTSLQGQELSLKSLAGKVVVLDFWATWCPACRQSVGELKNLSSKYPADKLVLLSVSADKDEKEWREFVAKKDMAWAQYRDADSTLIKSFGIHVFPSYVVVDGDGFIRQRLNGENPQQTVVFRLKDTLAAMPQLEGVAGK